MTDLIIIGGFLGAGKTTLLWTLARILSQKGKRVALITNDQASELVDTVLLESTGGVVKEVSGSCFCCNFNGLASAIEQSAQHADVIIAEPVGSCTDLSATIMQPLKEKYADVVNLRPLNVLADADKLRRLVKGESLGIHDSSRYIYRKQLEEADYIVINKTEALDEGEKAALKADVSRYFSKKNVYLISALLETGISEWMEPMLADQQAGIHMADVDYDIYAEGEAVLGWLNATISLNGHRTDWGVYLKNLMSALNAAFHREKMAIGHVKALLKQENELQVANITDTVRIKGEKIIGEEAVLTLNARVESTPGQLREIVLEAVRENCPDGASCAILELNCLQPGRPEPTYRYNQIYRRAVPEA